MEARVFFSFVKLIYHVLTFLIYEIILSDDNTGSHSDLKGERRRSNKNPLSPRQEFN